MEEKHIAWDKGIIADGLKEVLGFSPAQKTTKAMCNKRVKMERIDNKEATCLACLRERIKELEWLLDASNVLLKELKRIGDSGTGDKNAGARTQGAPARSGC